MKDNVVLGGNDMENELLENIVYDEIKVSFNQRIVNFLIKGIIRTPNWIFGGK